jgi:hypothetical protein
LRSHFALRLPQPGLARLLSAADIRVARLKVCQAARHVRKARASLAVGKLIAASPRAQ